MKKAFTISINKKVMADFKTNCTKNGRQISHVLEEFMIRYNSGIHKDDRVIEQMFENIMVTSKQLESDIAQMKKDIGENDNEVGEF